jgi:hypothetical protein
MGEFRIGRTFARHSYPDTPRGGGAFAFARNFAKGPGTEGAQPITDTGTQILWGTIDVPATPPNSANVAITPHVTGVVRVHGVVSVQNTSGADAVVTVQVRVNGVTVSTPAPETTVRAANSSAEDENGFAAIPFLAELTATEGLVIGTYAEIQILVTAITNGSLGLTVNDSTLEVQEVPVSTG